MPPSYPWVRVSDRWAGRWSGEMAASWRVNSAASCTAALLSAAGFPPSAGVNYSSQRALTNPPTRCLLSPPGGNGHAGEEVSQLQQLRIARSRADV